ncbi:amino acid transporter [Rhizopus microsporus]|uniref:Amino acid transporter n=1 Tax=Rhizopus microsporus TaxID=58291 RepID=A0A1X0RW33_RHIZD|nr:amino acid transporter [Rhizopus microsporus]
MSSTSTISNDAISQSNEYRQPKQIENLSPLAVGDQKLRRHLGYFSGTMMNVGQIIGTGIFSNPAFILLHSGSGGMMLILWVVGALFAATGVWNYLELGTMVTKELMPLSLGLYRIWQQYHFCHWRSQLCFAGFAGRLPNRPDLAENFSFHGTSNNPGSYATAIYYVIYAYGGWFNLNYVLDELKDPIKNLPKCAISALSLTTVLYILANIAYLAVLPAAVIKSSKLTVAANLFNTALGGVFGGRVLPVLVGMSSFGFVGVIFYSGSRIVLEAARTGFLPFDRFFSKLHPKLQTPIPALVLLYVIAMIFLLAPPPGTVFQFIVAFSGYGQYFFVGLSVVGLLILRRTQPDVKRPIKAPFVPYVVTIILALCSVGLWYYKLVYKDALATSYNAEIQKDGKQELFEDVYETYGSFKTTSSDTLDKVVVHEVSHKS